MKIEHLVVSGASYHGIQLLGAMFESQGKIFKLSELKSVYGTSAGAIVLAILLLNIERSHVYDFVINRPWDKTYKFGNNILSDLFIKKGVCKMNIISEILIPLLKSKLLDPDITLAKFYNVTNVDFHIIATDMQSLHTIDFSHTTHPELSLINAVYMSSSIPFIFQPKYYNDTYVLDGGLSMHFPVKPCIDNGAKPENILGFNVIKELTYQSNEETPLIEYTFQLLNNIFRRLSETSKVDIPHKITIKLSSSLKDFPNVINDSKVRERLWENGITHASQLQSRIEELV